MNRSKSRLLTALVLLVMTLASFACKKTPAPPPPPPPSTGGNTGITPIPPAIPAPSITLRADTVTITRGGTVNLTYESRNAATVDIQPGIGPVTPAATGTRAVTPASSVTYTATATGPGGTATDVLRITVNEPPPPPPAVTRGGVTQAPPPAIVLTSQQLFDRDMQAINFDYDKSDIREDQKPKLMTATNYMKANPNVRITIEGNADERGSEEYNLALGDRRANAVKQYLVAQGIPENRLSSVSYGEERPACSAQTEECFAQNRRAAFKLNP
jgi:peptidoglycan-associated lipoprotein